MFLVLLLVAAALSKMAKALSVTTSSVVASVVVFPLSICLRSTPITERDRVFHVGHEDVLTAVRRSSIFVIDMVETFEQRLREMTVAFLEEYPLDPVLIANTMHKAATIIDSTVGDDARDIYDVQEPYYRAVKAVKVEEPVNEKSPVLASEDERAIFGKGSSDSEGLLSFVCTQLSLMRSFLSISQFRPVHTSGDSECSGIVITEKIAASGSAYVDRW